MRLPFLANVMVSERKIRRFWLRQNDSLCVVLALVLGAVAVPGSAQDAKPSKFPLRLHVLAIDDTHVTVRMQPNWCGGSVPSFGGDLGGSTGEQGIPCGGGGNGGYTSFGGDDDLSGSGRGDLVTPPGGNTQGLNFSYEGCSRVRVAPGFHSLPARWKKRGQLEVVIPTDSITGEDRPMPTQKCTFKVKLQEFVYLRTSTGALLKVTQEAYIQKPSLRKFLSGGSETLQPRVPPTVSVKQLVKPTQ